MPPKQNPNSWEPHQEYVLTELVRVGDAVEGLDKALREHMRDEDNTIGDLKIIVAKLETKIAVWGAVIAGTALLAQPVLERLLK